VVSPACHPRATVLGCGSVDTLLLAAGGLAVGSAAARSQENLSLPLFLSLSPSRVSLDGSAAGTPLLRRSTLARGIPIEQYYGTAVQLYSCTAVRTYDPLVLATVHSTPPLRPASCPLDLLPAAANGSFDSLPPAATTILRHSLASYPPPPSSTLSVLRAKVPLSSERGRAAGCWCGAGGGARGAPYRNDILQ
jgi:hypothetical protein